jgi:hypothetical protein
MSVQIAILPCYAMGNLWLQVGGRDLDIYEVETNELGILPMLSGRVDNPGACLEKEANMRQVQTEE